MTLDAARVATLSPEEQAEVLLPLVSATADSYAHRNLRLDRDEIHSEALVAFAEALKSYDPARGELPAYVVAKVKFHLADYNRSNSWATMKIPRGTRVRKVEEKSVPAYAISSEPVALGGILQGESLETLRKAWRELPATERDLLRALHYEGKTRVELARECGVYKTTIDKRYWQALKKLRLLMGVTSV